MKLRIKIIIILLALVVPPLLFLFVPPFSVVTFFIWNFYTVKPRMVKVLYQTDHDVLLNSCRTIMKNGYSGKYNIRIDRDPEVNYFPKPILELNPTYLIIHEEGYVRLEMWGGMSHFGVLAYPDGFTPSHDGFKYGDKKLIEGLWYYDDGYRENPEYEKFIESLRPERTKELIKN